VLNRRDYGADLLDPVTRGEFGFRSRVALPDGQTFAQPRLSAYLLPVWRKTPLPRGGNRFSLESSGTTLREGRAREPGGFDSLFTALRLEHTLNSTLFNADVQYVIAKGPDRMPLLLPMPGASGIDLEPTYTELLTLGGGVRAVPNLDWWSKLTLKIEAAYKHPTSYDAARFETPDDYFQYAAGFDRIIDQVLSSKDALMLTAEYLGEFGASDPSTLLRPFASDVALRLQWSAGDFARSSIELRTIVDVEDGELIGEASLGRQLRFVSDDLRLELNGRYLRPSATSLLASLPNNSRVGADLRFDF
jgi:hypothetical protein